jgi:hypothetical protein
VQGHIRSISGREGSRRKEEEEEEEEEEQGGLSLCRASAPPCDTHPRQSACVKLPPIEKRETRVDGAACLCVFVRVRRKGLTHVKMMQSPAFAGTGLMVGCTNLLRSRMCDGTSMLALWLPVIHAHSQPDLV